MLLIVLMMLCLLVLALAQAAPRVATQIRREREKEMVFRAQQYVVAIQRYYHKFGAYPPNLDRLKETNGIHFLRRAWRDPLTRNGKWFFIHYGQVAVSGPAAAGATGKQPEAGGLGGFASPTSNPFSFTAGGFGPSLTGDTKSSNNKKKKRGGFGACHRKHKNASSAFGSSFSGAFGGGPIIGVASRDDRPAILMRSGKDRPCEWAFVYDPGKDKTLHVMPGMLPGAGGLPGQPPTPTGIGMPGPQIP